MSLRPISEPIHIFGNSSAAIIPVAAPLASGQTISIHKLIITASAATNVTIQDSSGAALSQAFPMSGSKGLVLDTNDNFDPYWTIAAGLGVQLAQSGSANIGFDAWFMPSVMPVNVPPGTVTGPLFTPTVWNQADKTNVTLSNSNITATSNATGQGCRGVLGLTTGKYYVEYTMATWSNSTTGCGLSRGGIGFTSGISIAGCCGVGGTVGHVYNNGGDTLKTVGAVGSGSVIGMAVDIGGQLIWFRLGAAGNWNGVAANNPATGVGGISISAVATAAVYPFFAASAIGEVCTANFGGSAFVGLVPAGFTAGWGTMQ